MNTRTVVIAVVMLCTSTFAAESRKRQVNLPEAVMYLGGPLSLVVDCVTPLACGLAHGLQFKPKKPMPRPSDGYCEPLLKDDSE